MANDKKFVVKNGLRADNVQFTDSASGLNQINVNMLNTDTLQFEGDAGTLLSISDDLTGTVFSVGDISGIPIIDAVGETHNITMAQYDGKVMIGTTDSGGVDSDKLNVGGTVRADKFITNDASFLTSDQLKIKAGGGTIGFNENSIVGSSAFYIEDPSNNRLGFDRNEIVCTDELFLVGNNAVSMYNTTQGADADFRVKIPTAGSKLIVGGGNDTPSSGVIIGAGHIHIRTDSAPAYIDFFCEVSNAHRVRVESPVHADYSGQVTLTLPNKTGTILSDSNTATLLYKTFDANGTGNSITNLEVADFAGSAIVTEAEGLASSDDDTSLPTTAAVKDYVDNNAGTGNAFTKIKVAGQTDVEASVADELTFVGSGINITTNATTDTITFTAAGGSGITIKDGTSGTTLTNLATTLNFTGAGVTATGSGSEKTITIPGGGGGGGGITAADAIIRSFLFG